MGAWIVVRMAWLKNPQPARLVMTEWTIGGEIVSSEYVNDPAPPHKAALYQGNPSKHKNWKLVYTSNREPFRWSGDPGGLAVFSTKTSGRPNPAPWGTWPGDLAFCRSREYVCKVRSS